MVRRGSAVRVRKRASEKALETASFSIHLLKRSKVRGANVNADGNTRRNMSGDSGEYEDFRANLEKRDKIVQDVLDRTPKT
jgi:hypothetical protein